MFMVLSKITKDLSDELVFKTSRSGGSGGQHVNKVSSKVELLFNIAGSAHLTVEEKNILETRLGNRVNRDGYIRVVAQEDRSQLKNKKTAIAKLYHLLEKNLTVETPRIATEPSKAAKEKRLTVKKKNSEIKTLRRKKDIE
jgi:ribosome-associated protein